MNAIAAVIGATLEVGELQISLGQVLAFAITLVVAWALSRLLRALLERGGFPRLSTQRGVPYAVSSFAGSAVLTVGFLLAPAAAGVGPGRLLIPQPSPP